MSLKSSIKSLEGKSTIGLLIAGAGALYVFATGDNNLPEIPVEEILKHATTVSEIKDAYMNDSNIINATGFAKISATLFFMYKVFSNFLGKRTELKKKEIEVDANTKTVVVPVNPHTSE